MTNVWLPTKTVPMRPAPIFALTCTRTVPFPVPEAPEVTAIHGSLPAAVHVHSAGADTLVPDVPPPESNESVKGASAILQPNPA